MAVQIQHRETMWVRHEQDQGKWWPAVGVGFTKSSSLLMTVSVSTLFNRWAKLGLQFKNTYVQSRCPDFQKWPDDS